MSVKEEKGVSDDMAACDSCGRFMRKKALRRHQLRCGLDAQEEVYEVEKILDSQTDAKGQIKYLVKWKGWDISTSTWEPPQNLTCCDMALKDFEKRRALENAEKAAKKEEERKRRRAEFAQNDEHSQQKKRKKSSDNSDRISDLSSTSVGGTTDGSECPLKQAKEAHAQRLNLSLAWTCRQAAEATSDALSVQNESVSLEEESVAYVTSKKVHITVRSYKPSDYARVRQMYTDIHAEYAKDESMKRVHKAQVEIACSDDMSASGLVRNYISSRSSHFWVVEVHSGHERHVEKQLSNKVDQGHGQLIVGFIGLAPFDISRSLSMASHRVPLALSHSTARIGEVKRLCIDPQVRRKGVGAVVIKHVEAWAKNRGFASLRLSTLAHMTPSLSFFLKAGFKNLSTAQGAQIPFFDDIINVMEMEKKITK